MDQAESTPLDAGVRGQQEGHHGGLATLKLSHQAAGKGAQGGVDCLNVLLKSG